MSEEWYRAARPLAIAAFCALVLAAPAQARRGAAPPSLSVDVKPLTQIDVLVLDPIDGGALIDRDERQRLAPGKNGKAAAPTKLLRYAEPVDMRVTPSDRGTWETLADGRRLWRLRVLAPGATDLTIGFEHYRMPFGATLYVRSESEDYYEGPYHVGDNKPHRKLYMPVIPGDRAVIELMLDRAVDNEPELVLGRVGRGYRDVFDRRRAIRAGACNNDVVCPLGDPYRDIIRSEAVIGQGASTFCSGQMVNNTADDCRPLFLTAAHCGVAGSAGSLTVYWNFESPTCGAQCCGSLAQNQTGATLLANRADVDVTLVELDSIPDPSHFVFYSGYDASGIPAPGSIGIHHPDTDEKSISYNDDPLTVMNSCIGSGGTNTHWRVNDWEDGTTEPGSSGSGLWDPDTSLLVGQLSGGSAACPDLNGYDCFGQIAVGWNGAGPASRLQDHLDPVNGGTTLTHPGIECSNILAAFYVDHASVDTCASDPSNDNGVWEPGEDIEISVTVRAFGNLTNVTGTLTSSTPGVTIVDDTATFPDLLGAPVQSDAPHFRVRLPETATCFSQVDFDLAIDATEGGPFIVSFSNAIGLDVIGGPNPIPDAGTVASVLGVADAVVLTGLTVDVEITHTYVGDLQIELESPAGTRLMLLDRPGEPAGPFGCGDSNLDMTFDDGAATTAADLEGLCAGSDPWYTGAGQPVQALAGFIGESTQGDWLLHVTDNANQDTGSIVAWRLNTTPPLSGACEVCIGGCTAQEIMQNTLLLTKGTAGSTVVLHTLTAQSSCAAGVMVWTAPTADPVTPPGSFPTDPPFVDVTAQDTDPGSDFEHGMPTEPLVLYKAVEDVAGVPGPSGSYGN